MMIQCSEKCLKFWDAEITRDERWQLHRDQEGCLWMGEERRKQMWPLSLSLSLSPSLHLSLTHSISLTLSLTVFSKYNLLYYPIVYTSGDKAHTFHLTKKSAGTHTQSDLYIRIHSHCLKQQYAYPIHHHTTIPMYKVQDTHIYIHISAVTQSAPPPSSKCFADSTVNPPSTCTCLKNKQWHTSLHIWHCTYCH